MTTESNLVLLASQFRGAQMCLRYCADEYPGVIDVVARLQRHLEQCARNLSDAMTQRGDIECYAVLGGAQTEMLRIEVGEVLR